MKFGKLIAVGLLATVGLSTVVNAATQAISAYLRDDVTYTLDAKPILNGEKAVVFEDKIYLPLRAVSEALGLDVDYKNGQVILTTKTESEDKVDNTEVNPVLAECDIQKATIVEVDTTENKLVVSTDANDLDNPLNQIIVYVTDNTNIAHNKNKMAYQLTDLTKGETVAIKTNGQMTMSLPGQTTAEAVILLDADKAKEDAPIVETKPVNPATENCDIKEATIVEVDVNGNKLIVSTNANDINNPNNQIIINVTENTSIAHHMNKMAYQLADLTAGSTVAIKTNGVMTESIPGQTTAESIVLLNVIETTNETAPSETEATNPVLENCDIKDATIVSIDNNEKQIIVSTDAEDLNNPQNQIVVNVTDATQIANAKNKMAYTLNDLESGQKVFIQTNGQMTKSIPAQTTAVAIYLA